MRRSILFDALALPYRSCALLHHHYPTLFLLRIVPVVKDDKRIPFFDVNGSLPFSKKIPGRGHWITCDGAILESLSSPDEHKSIWGIGSLMKKMNVSSWDDSFTNLNHVENSILERIREGIPKKSSQGEDPLLILDFSKPYIGFSIDWCVEEGPPRIPIGGLVEGEGVLLVDELPVALRLFVALSKLGFLRSSPT